MGGVAGGAVGEEDWVGLLADGVSLLVELVGDGAVGEYFVVLLLSFLPRLLLLLLLVVVVIPIPAKVPEMGELGLF